MFSLVKLSTEKEPGLTRAKRVAVLLLSAVMMVSLLALTVFSMTRTSITIDGNFSDWQAVLSDPDNVINDTVGTADPDYYDTTSSPGSFTDDRDLVRFVFTWDSTSLSFYFRRSVYANRSVNYLVYIDTNNDGTLTASDYIAVYKFNGVDYQPAGSGLFRYVPASPSGDPVTGNGQDEPGSCGSQIADASLSGAGGGDGNLEYETRIAWSSLVLSPGTPLRYHASTALGTNLPSQIQDNANAVSTLFAGVSVEPDNVGSAPQGTVKSYLHTVQNTGNSTDTINLTASSSQGWTVGIYDVTGNTTITSVSLAPSASTTITVKITIPGGVPSGTTDVTTVRGTSSVNSNKSDTATDTTTIGSTTVTPDNTGSMTTGTAISYRHTVANNTSTTDTVNLSAVSSQGWNVVFRNAADSTTITLVAVGPNSSVNIIARITVPATATAGSQDVTTVRGTSSNNPSNYDEARDTTTVKQRVLIDPDNEGATGAGTTIAYSHTVTNSWNTTDTIRLTATSSLSWTVRIYDSGGINETSSVTLGPNGAFADIIVRITVPSGTGINTVDVTTITATSVSNPSYFDTATDRTTVRALVTYRDPGRTSPSIFFRLGDAIYARGTNLSGISEVRFRWLDGNNVQVRLSAPVLVDASGKAEDQYTSSGTETVGNWTLILLNAANDQEITRTTFTVSYKAQVTSLTATDAPNLNTTITVSSAVRNDSEQTITASKINYVIWWDENGSNTFDSGDKYIGSDGLSYTWNGTSTVSTHETTGIAVNPRGGTWSESGAGWNISNRNFPYRGTYRVTATWRSSTGLYIDEKTTTFYSVPALGYPLLVLLGGAVIYFLYRRKLTRRVILSSAKNLNNLKFTFVSREGRDG